MIRNLVISLALAMSATCMAQSDYQYRMEIGAGVGAVAYQGDFGGSLTKNMQPMASAVLRRGNQYRKHSGKGGRRGC